MLNWVAFSLLGFFWGSSFLWIKIALEEASPRVLVTGRLTFGVLGLAGLLLYKKQKFPRGLKNWGLFFTQSVLHPFIPFLLISWGETKIDSGVASILNGTVPLFTIIIAHFFLSDDRMSRAKTAGLLLGFFGVLVLMSSGISIRSIFQGSGENLLGKTAVLAASLLYACGTIYSKKYLPHVKPIPQAFGILFSAGLLSWINLFLFEPNFRVPELPRTWFAFSWLGLLGSASAFALYFHLIGVWGATRSSIVNYVFPVVGLALGILFLDEQFNARLCFGTLLIISGIAIVNFQALVSNRRSSAKPAL